MTKDQRSDATNIAYEGMLESQDAIDTLDSKSLLLPIYRMLYNLNWIVYQILIEMRRKNRAKTDEQK